MLGLLISFLVKLGLMILPLAVLVLASRRLLRSRSANAWLYAATALFAWITTLGLVPWTFGFGGTHPVFFVFAAMTPAVWYSVATLCNSSRHMRYDSEFERTFLRLARAMKPVQRPAPLILEGADWPDAPVAVFRHSKPTPEADDIPARKAQPRSKAQTRRAERDTEPTISTRRLLDITRTMRRNRTSEDRRIKLLPPPDAVGANSPYMRPFNSA